MQPRTRYVAKFVVVLAVLGALLSPEICAKQGDYVAGHYVVGSPQPELRSSCDARLEAHQLAKSLPGAFVVRGLGKSMQPLYASGTFLVVQPQAYDQLARGMTVVFRNQTHSITHVLVAKTPDGWRTTGLNNRRPDYLPVNNHNILGVVVAAFTPVEGQAVGMLR